MFSFDDNCEVRGVYLDISKAFDKLWHEGIIDKLKGNRISGNFVSLLQCHPKLFAYSTSLFSTVKVPGRTANNLNNDLKEINKWDFQWKMSFNLDPTKQAQEVNF